METLRRIALALLIIGGINWGLIGLFQFDLVATIFGGQDSIISRIIYILVGLSSLLCLTLLFAPFGEDASNRMQTDRMTYGTEFGEESHISNDNNDDNNNL